MKADTRGRIPLEMLSELATRSFPSQQEAQYATLQLIQALLEMGTCFLSQITPQENRFEILNAYNAPSGFDLEPGFIVPLSDTFCETIAHNPRPAPLVLEDIRHDPLVLQSRAACVFPDVGSYIGVPITLANGNFFGTLCSVDRELHPFTTEHVDLMAVLARLIATQIEYESELQERHKAEVHLRQAHHELQNAYQLLTQLATIDPVTELPNHRSLLTAFDETLYEATLTKKTCTACFIDLDHFKAINDTYGHIAGDDVLRELGQVIRAKIRSQDTIGRWGGEEFLLLLRDTDAPTALIAVERLRASIASHSFRVGGGLHLTASLGLAVFPLDARTRTQLIEAADQAMYAAKSLGRNQVRTNQEAATRVFSSQTQGKIGNQDELAITGTIEALTTLVQARDAYTGTHIQDVAALAMRLARDFRLNEQEVHLIAYAAQLHDIGKVAIPDAILNKPGKLTPEEWVIMCTHPGVGADILRRIPLLSPIASIVRAHHERWDGQGYPDQIAGDEIPFGARIIAVADAFDAIITDRPYRKGREASLALGELQRCSGTQFDPQVITAMENLLLSNSDPLELLGRPADPLVNALNA